MLTRIVRVADAFTAATSRRVYANAGSVVPVLWEMAQGPCRRFYDPLLVDAMVRLISARAIAVLFVFSLCVDDRPQPTRHHVRSGVSVSRHGLPSLVNGGVLVERPLPSSRGTRAIVLWDPGPQIRGWILSIYIQSLNQTPTRRPRSHPEVPIEIIEIQPNDYDEVDTLLRDVNQAGAPPADDRTPESCFARCDFVLSLVARDEGAVVGAILCRYDDRDGYVHQLAIADPNHHDDLARSLVDRALRKLNARGTHKCRINLPSNVQQHHPFWEAARWTDQPDLAQQPVPSSAVIERLAAQQDTHHTEADLDADVDHPVQEDRLRA